MRKLVAIVLIFFSLNLLAQEQEVILQKHFEAHGQKLWDQISTMEITGLWVNKSFDKFPMRATYKYPDKLRIEGSWFGKKYAEVTNGKIAWTIAPWTGNTRPQYMHPANHLMIQNLLSNGSPIRTLSESPSLVGLELFEGELMIKFIFDDENFHREYYLDKDNYQLKWELVQSNRGQKESLKKHYEKYREYHGLLMPTALRVYFGDEVRELVFEDVALGVGASNGVFEFPVEQQN